MPIDRVVINASPLIVLFKSSQADLLPQLFNEILVPQSVWEEVTLSQSDIASQQLPNAPWARQMEVAIHPSIQYSGHFLRQRLKPAFHRWYLPQ
ncbi:hypothetical protein [Phormidesmis priestleyi]|uniref:hypothetical protein n=1 Tax=Phormidesmis priestleyi TaxID=268141 RepID=UPI00083B3060|nr:hypothetical protein [Phormidesmis priestleyi]